MSGSEKRETDSEKQEVVFTPLPQGKKISEMTHEELLAFASSLVEGTTRRTLDSSV